MEPLERKFSSAPSTLAGLNSDVQLSSLSIDVWNIEIGP